MSTAPEFMAVFKRLIGLNCHHNTIRTAVLTFTDARGSWVKVASFFGQIEVSRPCGQRYEAGAPIFLTPIFSNKGGI